MRRRRHQNAGFTLIELMVALAIFGLLLTAVYGAFRAALRAMGQVDAQSESSQLTRGLLTQVTSDLANLYPLQLPATEETAAAAEAAPASEEDAQAAPQERSAFQQEDARDDRKGVDLDTLSFVAVALDPAATQSASLDLAEITYYVDTDDTTPEKGLVRTVNALPGLAAEPVEPTVTEISPAVVSLNFRFWDETNSEWLDVWETTDALPPLIEVTLGLTQGDGKEPKLVQAILEPRSEGLLPQLTGKSSKAAATGQEAGQQQAGQQPGESGQTPPASSFQLPGGTGGGPALPGGLSLPSAPSSGTGRSSKRP
ncbi:MAG: hypothetical protein COZ06_02210 [Armatimonadetes bacterium CG_4_10_14_3_um_filter_66_18]|nr:prepilin-type N-terminal cleavage/methylation domain-containing protein [Armatimonadota bacterium]OIO93076.1 MAG: hypothetical protein AUJ96_31105 [Armatimonadetes bacterium CG2_30_66_41]PIU93704.1 MAG: hypothetical protein COS65_11570 [Armatimonadetes bacterium CG06_land_8_20_14_3_00_66_21]PIX46595.1 MAG: hypothetical protein COZ57_11235 [Armatimonadetes bacterium CG_4_8_14_3_um_filter_66_20]PIY53115.1 MAG: hypothetical protein COZ06_02210 [Armatimonadetes bacterium CG_4_10_14_3_um_filter_6